MKILIIAIMSIIVLSGCMTHVNANFNGKKSGIGVNTKITR
ncbi:hypothetical protein [Sulfurimonas sp.]|nr:hypothetical protein [Sulfurimonas sp.]